MIRELINIFSACDDWDFGARFRCSFNRSWLLTNEEATLPSLMREFVTLRVQVHDYVIPMEFYKLRALCL